MTPMTVEELVRFLETAPEEHCVVYLRKHPCWFCQLLEPVLQRVVERLGVKAYVADATGWTAEDLERVQQACFGQRLSFPTTITYHPSPGYGRWLLGYAPESVLEPSSWIGSGEAGDGHRCRRPPNSGTRRSPPPPIRPG